MTTSRLDFLVLGAQKSATSWLYRCLQAHPELHLPASKRDEDYLGCELHRRKGTEWYFSLLSGATPGQKQGDKSTEYLVDQGSPESVHEHAPHVRLIASLREPVSRALSAYYWLLRKKLIEATDANHALRRGLWLCERTPNDTLSEQDDYYRDLLLRGIYAPQLDRYLRRFPPEQISIVFYDDIKRSPLGSIQDLYRFLEVREDFVPRDLDRRPKRNTYDSRLVWLERTIPRLRVVAGALELTNRWLAKRGARAPALDRDLHDNLSRYLAPHNQALKQLLNQAASAGSAVGRHTGSLPAWL